MVFSSINPLFQLDDPPYNWQQQQPPAGRSVSDINNDNRIPHTTPPPMPPPHGLSIRPDSMVLDQRPRLTKLLQQETAHKCPRCASPNTKFCYYNNYSLSQPRYFCKTCRRYWTKGGALRNVPVGGGLRRNKKSKRSRVKSPVTGNYSGVSSSSCTADNVLGPSVVPHIPLLPSLNFVSDHVEAENISSLSFRRIQPLTTTLMSDYIYNNQWRMQEFGFSAGLELPSAGSVYQFGNEGVAEVASADQYGSKTVEFCNPSQVDQLVKFEENDQEFMNLPKNFTSFQEYEHQQFCSNGDASDGRLNISSTGHDLL